MTNTYKHTLHLRNVKSNQQKYDFMIENAVISYRNIRNYSTLHACVHTSNEHASVENHEVGSVTGK